MKSLLVPIVRVLLGVIFIASGLAKLIDLDAFAHAIMKFDVLPSGLIQTVAVVLPSVEFICGISLLLGSLTRISSAVIIGLLLVFVATIIPHLVSGEEFDCGCFGPLVQSKVNIGLLLRDLVLMGLTLMIYLNPIQRFSIDQLIGRKMMARNLKARPVSALQIVYVLLVLILGFEVVVLLIQNRNLKETIYGSTAHETERLKPGDFIDKVNALSLSGEEIPLTYSDPSRKYLLFIFSTTCPHCEKNVALWQGLVKDSSSGCYYLGISTSSFQDTKAFVQKEHIKFRTVSVATDSSFRRKYKVFGVPQTILLNHTGVVEKVWLGELNLMDQTEIEKLSGASSVPLLN